MIIYYLKSETDIAKIIEFSATAVQGNYSPGKFSIGFKNVVQ